MAGTAPGAIMDEDYFGSAAEWGDEADSGQVRGAPGAPDEASWSPSQASRPRPRRMVQAQPAPPLPAARAPRPQPPRARPSRRCRGGRARDLSGAAGAAGAARGRAALRGPGPPGRAWPQGPAPTGDRRPRWGGLSARRCGSRVPGWVGREVEGGGVVSATRLKKIVILFKKQSSPAS